MTCRLLLRRANGSFLQHSVFRGRTYHVASKRMCSGLNTSPVYPALRVIVSIHSQIESSTRLYSTSGQSSDASTGQAELEMFRETPAFPPEWNGTSTPADGTDPMVELVTETDAAEVITSTIGGYTPVGVLQTLLEFVHSTVHLPWWLSIVSVTVAIRIALFPLAVKMQTNAAKIANINPYAQVLHKELLEFKMAGNKQAEAEHGMKLLKLYQENDCHPAKMFIMPFAQMPIFISFFMALRGMARLPVESFKTGGTLWFTDLTVPDPVYALPLIACAMFLSNVELGGEGGAANTNETHKRMKLFLRASGFLILPISITFPSALFCYWVTNSAISTFQILLFKIPAVKSALGIPKIVRPPTG